MYREWKLQVPGEYEGHTIEKFLKKYAGFTGKQISQAKFRPGGLRVNGKQQRSTYCLREGELLSLCVEEEHTGSHHLEASAEDLEILYEDEDVLAVHKMAGLVCHPSRGHYCDTLANQVAAYYRSQGIALKVRSIGRLDKEVSGIVVFGKNQLAAARLSKQREQGIFRKEYLALTEGIFLKDKLYLTDPIGHSLSEEQNMQARPDGKRACTQVTVLERMDKKEQTLVSCRIFTGRTHQIRVHLSGSGHPIVGDVRYGAKSWEQEGIGLHAWKAEFLSPLTGCPVLLEKLPERF